MDSAVEEGLRGALAEKEEQLVAARKACAYLLEQAQDYQAQAHAAENLLVNYQTSWLVVGGKRII